MSSGEGPIGPAVATPIARRLWRQLRWLVLLLLLNGMVFVPGALLSGQWWPEAAAESPWYWREGFDPARLQLELWLLAALLPFLPRPERRPAWRWLNQLVGVLAPVVYVGTIVYYGFDAGMRILFQRDPVFYGQRAFLVDGVTFLAEHLTVPWVQVALGIGGGVVVAGAIMLVWRRWWRDRPAAGSMAHAIVVAVVALGVVQAVSSGTLAASPHMVPSSLAARLAANVRASAELADRIAAFDAAAPERVYDYRGYALQERPNVYLIVVESYGRVLGERPQTAREYLPLLDELQERLSVAGWHAASAFSESPTWGGGSWMAYTSLFFGMRVDSHPQYLALRNTYQDVPYPDLGRFLQSQGYRYVHVTSLAQALPSAERQAYEAFFGMDRWLTFDDLEYTGTRYGWGPAPPDQYVLNFAHETLVEAVDEPSPLFMFMITQNSHYPWVPQPPLVEDWQTLNEPVTLNPVPAPETIGTTTKRRHYLEAMKYQLNFLVDFVVERAEPDALVILIGDHQPQQVSSNESFDTPLHIITRDDDLLARLEDFGLAPGMQPAAATAPLRHEGLYSLLLNTLIAEYGDGVRLPPPYLPEGLPLATSVADS